MSPGSAVRKPRVLLHVFSTFRVGGPQVRFAQIANRLASKYRHLIMAMDGAYDSAELLDGDVDFEIIRLKFNKKSTIRNLNLFQRTLGDLRPDLLVTYNWGATEWGLANFVRRIPHVHIEDGFGPEEAHGQLRRRILFRRLMLSRDARLILPSLTLHKIATGVWRIDPSRVMYIPNGIDCRRFEAAADRSMVRKLAIADGEAVIGTVAALRREKNLDRLLRAFARIPGDAPARLVIAGEGPERAPLEALSRELDIADRVVFTGYVAEPETVLAALDVFALSSDTEQMPYSVLEAMAAGLPIAGVDVGDVKHIVAAENKPHIGEANDEQLAETLRFLLGNSKQRRAIGQANREHVAREYDQDRMFESYDSVFGA